MKPKKVFQTVTPAEAGVQMSLKSLDSRLRGNDVYMQSFDFFARGLNYSGVERCDEPLHSNKGVAK